MGTTATGLSSTPGTIVTWPLNGRSPFSATTQPSCSRHDTAPVPLVPIPRSRERSLPVPHRRDKSRLEHLRASYFHVGDGRQHRNDAADPAAPAISATDLLFADNW